MYGEGIKGRGAGAGFMELGHLSQAGLGNKGRGVPVSCVDPPPLPCLEPPSVIDPLPACLSAVPACLSACCPLLWRKGRSLQLQELQKKAGGLPPAVTSCGKLVMSLISSFDVSYKGMFSKVQTLPSNFPSTFIMSSKLPIPFILQSYVRRHRSLDFVSYM